MIDSHANRHKSDGCSTEADKTALVVVDVPGAGTRTVLVNHYIVADGGETLVGYLGDRSEGVDFKAAMENCLVTRSQRAREAFDVDAGEDTNDDTDGRTGTHADREETVMTDGGLTLGERGVTLKDLASDERERMSRVPYDSDGLGSVGDDVIDYARDGRGGVLFAPEDELNAPQQYMPATTGLAIRYSDDDGDYRTLGPATRVFECAATGDAFVPVGSPEGLDSIPSTCPVCESSGDECQVTGDDDGQTALDAFGAVNGGES